MLLLAIATSIDALAVGITFAFFEINIFTATLFIGLKTFCISKGEFIGGAILIIIGLKILIEGILFK